MELSGKKIAVLAESEYDTLELWYPTIRMREAGAEVTIVGTGTNDTYFAGHGYNFPVNVDVAVDRVTADDFDAVIIPGGYAPDRLRRYPAVLKLVRDIYQQGKVVAAVCHAPWVLVSSGILKGKTITSTAAIKDDVINAGAKYIDQEVVRDDNLITSRSPRDLPAFCRTIIAAMAEKPVGVR